jgi:hypothetical protein
MSEEHLSLQTLTVAVQRLVLTLRRIHFLAAQCIYVSLRILKSNSDYFHIHHSPIGLSDGNTISCAKYELRLYM